MVFQTFCSTQIALPDATPQWRITRPRRANGKPYSGINTLKRITVLELDNAKQGFEIEQHLRQRAGVSEFRTQSLFE